MIRQWLKDVILRSAEMIKEREGTTTPAPVNVSVGAKCMFCDGRDHIFEISTPDATAYACHEHVGPMITDWTVAKEITVVRL